jgi:cation-transporting ATPase E
MRRIFNRSTKSSNTSKRKVKRIYASPDIGLTSEQVNKRISQGLYNKEVESPTKSTSEIILGNILTYFNLIFFVLALALVAVGSYQDLLFMVIVGANLIIGIVQELDAKRKLDELVIISETMATVVRDRKVMKIPVDQLVLDDIVILSRGSHIYADAELLEGEVMVDESLVTGESDEIPKRRGDFLLSGSFIVSGECKARLENIGEDSFVSQLTLAAKKGKKRQPAGMMKSLTRLLQVIGVLIIPIGVFLYRRQVMILGLTIKEGVESTTGALVGMIPAGLYLLVSVALAASVVRIAKKETVVHEFKSVETLARVNVLCLDKTGTITENDMKVTDLILLNEDIADEKAARRLLADFAANLPANNATMQAIKDHFKSFHPRRAKEIHEFTSKTKQSRVLFDNNEEFILGAPEIVLGDQVYLYEDLINAHASLGKRVLLFGSYRYGYTEPLALVILENPVKPTAKDTFSYFIDQGVELKVISGDNPLTVSIVAKQAGIPKADNYIDATTLTSLEDLEEAIRKYTVFGRVTPEQKKQIIKALKKAGKTVAMTGDGINDVLALKEADCSIAMASGSDVASQVSDLVLLSSNFDSLPSIVAEGRRVINNIERTASLFLVKNIFSFALALISITAVFAYPLTPAQLALVSGLTIGVPAFFLALEPNSELVRGNFLINVLYKAFPAALTNLFIVIIAVLFSIAFKMPLAEISTVTTILIAFVGFCMIWRVSTPFNLRRIILFVSLIIAFIIILIFVPSLFSLSPLSLGSGLVLFVLALLIIPVMNFFTRCFEKVTELIKR